MSGMVMLVAGCTEAALTTAPVETSVPGRVDAPSPQPRKGLTILTGRAADSAMSRMALARADAGDSTMLFARQRLRAAAPPVSDGRAGPATLAYESAAAVIYSAQTFVALAPVWGGPAVSADMLFEGTNANHRISYTLSGRISETMPIEDPGPGVQVSNTSTTRRHSTYIHLGRLPSCGLRLKAETGHYAWNVQTSGTSTSQSAQIIQVSRGETANDPCRVGKIEVGALTAIEVGGSATAMATVYDQYDEEYAALCSSFDWSSSNQQVAVVGSDGVVSGLSPGSATISASCGGVTGTTAVSVVCPGSGASDAIAADGDPCNTGSGSSGSTSGLPTGYWIQICQTTYYGWYDPWTGNYEISYVETYCWLEWQNATDLVATDGKPRGPDDVLLVAGGATRDPAPARLVRRASGEHRDVIVVDTTRATARDLAGAVAILQAHRAAGVPVPASGAHSVVTSFTPSAEWERTARASFQGLLTALERQPVRDIAGYGPRRALSVAVPGVQVRRQ